MVEFITKILPKQILPINLDLTQDYAFSGIIGSIGATLIGEFKPKIYSQDTEPDIPDDACAFWRDTANNKTYLIIDRAGTQEKVEVS